MGKDNYEENALDDPYLRFCEQIISDDVTVGKSLKNTEAASSIKEEPLSLNSKELDSLRKAFVKICINEYPVFDELKRIDPDTKFNICLDNMDKDKNLMDYRRKDLARLAKEAFDRGEEYFYCEPEDANSPYGNFVSCDPKFGYDLKRTLTEKEYNFLFRRA